MHAFICRRTALYVTPEDMPAKGPRCHPSRVVFNQISLDLLQTFAIESKANARHCALVASSHSTHSEELDVTAIADAEARASSFSASRFRAVWTDRLLPTGWLSLCSFLCFVLSVCFCASSSSFSGKRPYAFKICACGFYGARAVKLCTAPLL